MSKFPIEPLQACEYIRLGYKNHSKLNPTHTLNKGGIQAYVFKHNNKPGLLIEGSNERSDWVKFNFRFWPKKCKGSTRYWHKGFLNHANVAYRFAKDKNITFVLGHSLGAAAAQIVGSSLCVPTMAFASPRPLRDFQPKGHGFVQNICRTDDLVCFVPFKLWGYKHVGQTHWLKPKKRNKGQDHSIEHYIRILGG